MRLRKQDDPSVDLRYIDSEMGRVKDRFEPQPDPVPVKHLPPNVRDRRGQGAPVKKAKWGAGAPCRFGLAPPPLEYPTRFLVLVLISKSTLPNPNTTRRSRQWHHSKTLVESFRSVPNLSPNSSDSSRYEGFEFEPHDLVEF